MVCTGKSMMMFNICVENQMKALKEGKLVVFDLSYSEIETIYKNRDSSNNGILILDHIDKLK
jgi:hypothetical protein